MTEKMKPSGITWIGDIPSDWQVKRLKYACQKITDGSHFSPETVDEGKVYITVSDLHGDTIHTDTAKRIAPSDFAELVKNGCQPNPGDVLLSKDGTVGRSAIVNSNNDYVVLSSIGILTPGTMLLSNYLKYNLDGSHLQEQMLRAMDGSALKRITISKIAEFFAVIPPIGEQNVISDFLDTQCAKIDSVIADIEKQIETLQKYKKSLITEVITDKNDCWKYGRVKDLMTLQRGHDLAQEEFVVGNIPVYGSNGVIGHHNVATTKGPNITIGRSGSVGALNYVECDFWAHNTAIFVSNDKGNYMRYLYYILRSFDVKELANGSAVPTLDRKKVEGVHLFFTLDREEQKRIADYLDERIAKIDGIVDVKQTQLATIRQHKKSLIYEYVTGKKRVTEVN